MLKNALTFALAMLVVLLVATSCSRNEQTASSSFGSWAEGQGVNYLVILGNTDTCLLNLPVKFVNGKMEANGVGRFNDKEYSLGLFGLGKHQNNKSFGWITLNVVHGLKKYERPGTIEFIPNLKERNQGKSVRIGLGVIFFKDNDGGQLYWTLSKEPLDCLNK